MTFLGKHEHPTKNHTTHTHTHIYIYIYRHMCVYIYMYIFQPFIFLHGTEKVKHIKLNWKNMYHAKVHVFCLMPFYDSRRVTRTNQLRRPKLRGTARAQATPIVQRHIEVKVTEEDIGRNTHPGLAAYASRSTLEGERAPLQHSRCGAGGFVVAENV